MESENRYNNDKTQQYRIKSHKKTRRNKEEDLKVNKKGKKKKKHSKLKKAILIFFLIIFLLILAAIGAFAGIFFSDKWSLTKEDLIANGNTVVLDADKKQIAVLSATGGNGNRKIVTFDKMGKYTANAYIAIEDKRFYEHHGVDFLRSIKAMTSYLLNGTEGSDAGGGSTITQQLVKNLMKDKADTGSAGIERKIREMSRAYKLEDMLEKEEILEKYLNIIYVGGSDLHGVEYGAQYYFAKSAEKLELVESAFLAGINHSPNWYDPYDKNNDHTELIKSRTKLVLDCMKEQNLISENAEEAEKLYNEAVEKLEAGLEFKKGKIELDESYSYFVSEAIKQATKDLAEKKDIDYEEADTLIKGGGYTLYTTQNTKIQNILIKEMANDTYVTTKTITVKNEETGKNENKTVRTNAAMTIIEPSTGKVVALAGDLQQDVGSNYNYAIVTDRQTGSSIKPLANLAPGLEEKVLTASTIYNDVRTHFNNGTSTKYYPKNVGSYYGLCTVRKAIERSSNVVNIKMMINVGVDKAVEYLNQFGLTTYVKGEESLTLAIGGTHHSSSTLQMAAAYATLANGGEYIEPTFYTELKDSSGNTVVEAQQQKRRVISEANAYIISDILTDVVTGSEGTAKPCAISGMDVAAKTGTTDYNDNKWLCGYTPYYAAATWYGFGYGAGENWSVPSSKVNSARTIWANVMSTVHKELKLKAKRFEKPDDVVTAKICKQSGMEATSSCKSKYTEYFAKGTVPEKCDGHVTVKVCKESGKVATEYCPDVEEKTYTEVPEKEKNPVWEVLNLSKYKVPEAKCTIHTEETSKVTVVNVVGKTEAEARASLAGLTIQVIDGHDSSVTNGIVLRQSLAEGTVVDKGISITITVNKIETGGTTSNPGGTSTGGGTTSDPGGTTPGGNTGSTGEGSSGGSTSSGETGGSTAGGGTTTTPGGGSTGETTSNSGTTTTP